MKESKQNTLTVYLLWAFLIAWALQIAAGLMYRRGNGMAYTALLIIFTKQLVTFYVGNFLNLYVFAYAFKQG